METRAIAPTLAIALENYSRFVSKYPLARIAGESARPTR
jgi:hypothetical protein